MSRESACSFYARPPTPIRGHFVSFGYTKPVDGCTGTVDADAYVEKHPHVTPPRQSRQEQRISILLACPVSKPSPTRLVLFGHPQGYCGGVAAMSDIEGTVSIEGRATVYGDKKLSMSVSWALTSAKYRHRCSICG
jgi:hypothetical protein